MQEIYLYVKCSKIKSLVVFKEGIWCFFDDKTVLKYLSNVSKFVRFVFFEAILMNQIISFIIYKACCVNLSVFHEF